MIRFVALSLFVLSINSVFNQTDVKDKVTQLNETFYEALYEKGDEQLAANICDSLKLLYQKTGAPISLYQHFSLKGTLFFSQGNYKNALNSFSEALEVGKSQGDTAKIVASEMNVGSIFYVLNNYDKALQHYLETAKIMEANSDERIDGLYGNIGMVYNDLNDLEKAEFYLKRSLTLTEKYSKDVKDQIKSLNVLGMVYRKRGLYKKSEETFLKALKFSDKDAKYNRDRADIHSNLAELYKETNDLDQQKHHILKSINLYIKTNNYSDVIYSKKALADYYFDKGKIKEATAEIREALSLFDTTDVNISLEQGLYSSYARIMYAQKQYKDAYDKLEMGYNLSDTLFDLMKVEQAAQLETKYFYQQKMKLDSIQRAEERKKEALRIKKEKAESETALAQQKLYSLLGVGGSFSLLIIAFILLKAYRNKNKSNVLISAQKKQIETKQNEILDSIQYAKRIQTAILPSENLVKTYLKNSFILYKPKDVVAGDFYWMEDIGDKILFAAADCTGHGVPGAMVSVVCNNGLNRSVREYGLRDPDQILNKTREIIVEEFEKSEEEVKDGMDISMCSLSLSSYSLSWAGANNPLWIIRKGSNQIEEIKADKQPIGKYENAKPYTQHKIQLQKGDSIYIFTDGFQDQFGGEKNKKFKSGNFKKLLLTIQGKSMEEQKNIINKAFEDWKSNFEQVDDVCVIGVRV